MRLQASAKKYLTVETTSSAVFNAILNYIPAVLIFRGRALVPAAGPGSLLLDSIGETFFVVLLSTLIPTLIARSRRRSGTLPRIDDGAPVAKTNVYLRSGLATLVFLLICVSVNALVLPRAFPNGVSHGAVITFKTLYGTVIGALATHLALRKAMREEG